MKRHRPSVLVDTNAIVECHRTGSWKAVSRRYRLETVVQCARRICQGGHRRSKQGQIDQARLVASLNAVHEVSERELAELALRTCGIHLAGDEAALWAHALGRDDDWVFVSSDAAGIRCGVRSGFRHRLASLERIFRDVGHRPKKPLRAHHTEEWHRRKLDEIVVVGATALPRSA